jgi:hypothetical protein
MLLSNPQGWAHFELPAIPAPASQSEVCLPYTNSPNSECCICPLYNVSTVQSTCRRLGATLVNTMLRSTLPNPSTHTLQPIICSSCITCCYCSKKICCYSPAVAVLLRPIIAAAAAASIGLGSTAVLLPGRQPPLLLLCLLLLLPWDPAPT